MFYKSRLLFFREETGKCFEQNKLSVEMDTVSKSLQLLEDESKNEPDYHQSSGKLYLMVLFTIPSIIFIEQFMKMRARNISMTASGRYIPITEGHKFM